MPATINADGTPLTAAIDWLARESADRSSRLYQKVETSRVAAMGMSYNEDNGGAFGATAVAWLRWQLMNDTGATARGYFVGNACGLCGNAQWKRDSRSLR